MTDKTPTQSETLLREALADWDQYDPDPTRAKVIQQASNMANAIRAALQSISEPLLTAQEEADLVDQINGSYYLQPNPKQEPPHA